MASPFEYEVHVEFRDTDAAGIAHFSVFFLWMERAEHAAMRHLGISVMDARQERPISWPRVSVTCDYKHPVRFEETVMVTVGVQRLGNRSVTYRFDFRGGSRQVASGQVTTVCCQQNNDGHWGSITIPDDLAKLLGQLKLPAGDAT